MVDDDVGFFGGVVTFQNEADYVPDSAYTKPRKSRPTPSSRPLSDWVRPRPTPTRNRFEVLTSSDPPQAKYPASDVPAVPEAVFPRVRRGAVKFCVKEECGCCGDGQLHAEPHAAHLEPAASELQPAGVPVPVPEKPAGVPVPVPKRFNRRHATAKGTRKAPTETGDVTLTEHGPGYYTPSVETDGVRSDLADGLGILFNVQAKRESGGGHPLNKEPVNCPRSVHLTQSGHCSWPQGASLAPATVQGDESSAVIPKPEQSDSNVSGIMGVPTDEPEASATSADDKSKPPDLCPSDDEGDPKPPASERQRRNLRAAALQVSPEIEDIVKAML